MSTKRQGVACYDKAGMDEPLFVLRAQDRLAADVVREWAHRAEAGGTKSEIVDEARQCANQMEAWPFHKHPGVSQVRHEPDKPAEAGAGMPLCHKSFGVNDSVCYRPKGHEGPCAPLGDAAPVAGEGQLTFEQVAKAIADTQRHWRGNDPHYYAVSDIPALVKTLNAALAASRQPQGERPLTKENAKDIAQQILIDIKYKESEQNAAVEEAIDVIADELLSVSRCAPPANPTGEELRELRCKAFDEFWKSIEAESPKPPKKLLMRLAFYKGATWRDALAKELRERKR